MKRSFYLKEKVRCLLSSILVAKTIKKAGLIILVFLWLGNTVLAQDADSVIKTHFIYPNSELDSFLVDNLVRPAGCQWFGINANIDLVFVVDTFGIVQNSKEICFKPYVHELNDKPYEFYKSKYPDLINSFQALQIHDSMKNLDSAFINEAFRVIKFTDGLWIPEQKDGKRIQSEVIITVKFESDYYEGKEKPHGFHQIKINQYALDVDTGLLSSAIKTVRDLPADDPTKYYNLGVKKLTQKKYLLAHKYFLTAVTLDKSDADAWYNLGVTNHLIKNKIEACQCWVKALQLGIDEARENIEKYCKW